MINICYNHVDVDKSDKGQLLKQVNSLKKWFEDEKSGKSNRDNIVNAFSKIIELINKIIEYMEWDEKEIANLKKEWHKYRKDKKKDNGDLKGNTEEEEKEIEELSKKSSDKFSDKELIGLIKGTINSNKNISDQDILKSLRNDDNYKNWEEKALQDYIKHVREGKKQESYTIRKRLQRLLERAEA